MAEVSKKLISPFVILLFGLIAAAIIFPIGEFLFQLIGAPLADGLRVPVIDQIFYFGPSLLIAFFLGVVLGWFTKKDGVKVGLVTAASAIILESLSRVIRLDGNISANTVFFAIISPKFFLYKYLLLLVGLVLGTILGNKAYREKHFVRIYVFGGFLLLLIFGTQIYFLRLGLDVFNPLSRIRGIM